MDLKIGPETSEPGRSASQGSAPQTALAEARANLPAQRVYSIIVLSGVMRLIEFMAIVVCGAAVYWIYLKDLLGYDGAYILAIPALAALAVAIFHSMDTYHVAAFRALAQSGLKIAGGWTLAFLIAFALVFFLKLEGVFSRVFFGSWYVSGLAALLAARAAAAIATRKLTARGLLDRRAVIVGGGAPADALIRQLTQGEGSDIKILGVFDDRNDERSPDLVASHPKLGTVTDLIEFARHARIDIVLFSLPVTAETRILEMLRRLWVLPVDIRLAAHLQKLRFKARHYSHIGETPVFALADKPLADWGIVSKFLFDKIGGALLLLLLSPVMLLTALAVRLDSKGPVFFRQKRYGFNNELVEVFKFRSMFTEMTDARADRLVSRDDPRVTRVGRFIRKTSIDELPQLFNVVFSGNLSLVGPRPHAVNAKAAEILYDEVVDGYFARHRVKPGITGWAQINGWRGETDTREKIEKRVEHDLYYIENWSLLFDAYIVLMTPFALAKTENAY